MYCVFSWIIGPLQNIFFVLFVSLLLGNLDTPPVALLVLPLWALNFSFTIWQYWEGLRINASVSRDGRRRFYEPILVMVLIPFLSLLEGIGGFCGFLKFLRNEENTFVVIAKPA